jgi:hypothetical protein
VQNAQKPFFPRWAAIVAVAVGVAAGSYGIATAATGNSGAGSAATAAATTPSAAAPSTQPWGHQRSDETLLTGDTLSKVTAAAQAKVPGGAIIRVETDADGNAAYEAHMTNTAGDEVTVYVDKSFNVVSVETR